MNKSNRPLTLVVDMYGCPNRCKHCWLGHFPNRIMEDGFDQFIVDCFRPYFESVTFYSWLREPDYCNDYAKRWKRDNELSVGIKPQHFELASFYRLVRDEQYVRFLKTLNVQAVQLTFFGMQEMTDKYVGRKGAFSELLTATEILIENKIAPRWQAFINAENADEVVSLLKLSKELSLKERCKKFDGDFVFFVHSGSCDGENRKLYHLRINKENIPSILVPYYNNYHSEKTEAELCVELLNDNSHFVYHNESNIVLNISNSFDVYFNFTHMTPEWRIGNLKTDSTDEIVRKILKEDIPALSLARNITVSELVELYGNISSHKIFDCFDFKAYLLNRYIEEHNK